MRRNLRAFFTAVLCALLPALAAQAADRPSWFRGQLHSHTYRSDGRGFPEQAIDAYKQRGYQFLALTDHNRFADDTNAWRDVAEKEGSWPPKTTRSALDSYMETFGRNWADIRTNGAITSVRLKTYDELKARFEEPGRFILLPGVELTQSLKGIAVHLNYVNLPVILPCIQNAPLIKTMQEPATVTELLALNAAEAEQAATERGLPYLLMVNHPFWVYYDIVPRDLMDCPEIRFVEICNGGSAFEPNPQAAAYTYEKFWDVVNAFRLTQGHPLLYGVASDDAHFYDAQRINGDSGVGEAWIMVRAGALTPEALIAAMRRGEFYASNGVLLDTLEFTPTDKTLHVQVHAEPGVHYRIVFITTRRGFDPAVTLVTSPAEQKRPARTIPVYSEEIGQTVKTVEGTQATYRMEEDDLYVRARVESDVPSKTTPYFHPKSQTAWTPPYAHP